MPIHGLALPALTPLRRRLLIGLSAAVAVAIWLALVSLAEPYDWSRLGTGHDARPYWTAAFEAPYATSRVGAHDAYLYSPAFLQVIAPLRALPWEAFMGGWLLLLIAALLYLVGPVLLAAVAILALPELMGGNISLLLAAAIVVGFRWPAAWAFVVLTKVTPGVGLLWFAARREWRQLGIALGATLAVVAISFVTAPSGVWADWIGVLLSNATAPITSGSVPVPLLVRLPVAALVIVWAARGDRRWALPIGCLLALPVIWYGSLSILVATIPLLPMPRLREWHWPPVIEMAREWWHGHGDARRSPPDRQAQRA